MRSVVVVFPASMWAMMPMFRVRSSGAGRGMVVALGALPAVVGESLVGLRHAVRVFLLLHGAATARGRIEDLTRELLHHRLLGTHARILDEPAHGEGHPARLPHLRSEEHTSEL